MEIKIPKSFQLTGHTYKVKLVKKVDKEDSCGEVLYEKKLIKLRKPTKDYTIQMVEETLLHEIIHAILYECEYKELSENEELIERLSRAVKQVIKTLE